MSSDSVMGDWLFSYDTLNRLTSSLAMVGPYTSQSGCWAYDSFGNRTAESWQTAACPTPETSVPATASYNGSNQVTWTSVNAAASGCLADKLVDTFRSCPVTLCKVQRIM
jgi:hypothetical protein